MYSYELGRSMSFHRLPTIAKLIRCLSKCFPLILFYCSVSIHPLMSQQLAGAAVLGVGIWVKVDSASFFSLLDKIPGATEELNQVLNVGYLLIAVGGVLLVLGFLGCCGAMKESKCMLLLVRLWT